MGNDQITAEVAFSATIASLTTQACLVLEYRLQCFETNLNRQMIDLKYGIGYRETFIKSVISAVNAI